MPRTFPPPGATQSHRVVAIISAMSTVARLSIESRIPAPPTAIIGILEAHCEAFNICMATAEDDREWAGRYDMDPNSVPTWLDSVGNIAHE